MGDPALALSFSEKLKMFGGKAYNSILPEKAKDNRDLVTRNRGERQRSGSLKNKLVALRASVSPSPPEKVATSEPGDDSHSYSEGPALEEKSTSTRTLSSPKSFLSSSDATDDERDTSDTIDFSPREAREKGKEKELEKNNEGDASTEEEKEKGKEKEGEKKKRTRKLSVKALVPNISTTTTTEYVAGDDLGLHLLGKEELELSRQFILLLLQQKKEREEWKAEKEALQAKEKERGKQLHKEKNRRRSMKKKLEQANKDLKKGERELANLEKQLRAKEKDIENLKKVNEEHIDALNKQKQKFKETREAERKGKEEVARLTQSLRRVEESLGMYLSISLLDCDPNHLNSECVICNEDMSTVLLLPCKHQVLCRTCAGKVAICPICRIKVEDKIQIFNHREKDLFRTTFANSNEYTWTTASSHKGH